MGKSFWGTLLLIFGLGAYPAVEARAQFSGDISDFDFSFFQFGNPLIDYVDKLANQRVRTRLNIEQWQKSVPSEARSCRALYDDIFKDGVMRVTFVFGYHDASGRTLDGRFYQYTFDALTRRCPNSSSPVCGYRVISGSRSSYTAVLSRPVQLRAANGTNRLVEIRIQLARSSHSSDDERNLVRGEPSEKQRELTRHMEDLFFGGISGFNADGSPREKCEICAYFGHARDGGGPDFGPVPYAWRKADGKPNYDLYQARRPGYRKLIASLKRAQNDPPKLVALQACYSHLHFWSRKTEGKSLSDFADKTGFLLTRKLSWPQNFQQTVGVFLDTVLGLRCKSAWDMNNSRLHKLPEPNEAYDIFGRFF